MAKKKFDGVVEAVHYQPDGQVEWVRAYLRRGATWSDHVLLDRHSLLQRVKSGNKFVAGKRLPYLAGTFETTEPIRIVERNGVELLTTTADPGERDRLDGVPII